MNRGVQFSLLNPPNIISLARLVLCVGLAVVLSFDLSTKAPIALALFIFASITDWLDGYLARRHNQITSLGKLLDPLADKILICTAFIGLFHFGLVSLWMVVLIMSREFLVTGLRLIAAAQGVVLAAEKLGKHKMFSQVITLILGYGITSVHTLWVQENTAIYWLYIAYHSFLGLTLAITLLSGIIYFWRNRHALNPGLNANRPLTSIHDKQTARTSSTTPAFKDWQVITDALQKGSQILILRKGGIHENKGSFSLQFRRFWLFPTSYHQQYSLVKNITPPQASEKEPTTVSIRSYAEVTHAFFIRNASLIPLLSPFHHWKDEVIEERFHQSQKKGLFAMIVRVYILPFEYRLPMHPSYGGCRSWVELPLSFEAYTATPVLEDEEFNKQQTSLLSLLERQDVEKII